MDREQEGQSEQALRMIDVPAQTAEAGWPGISDVGPSRVARRIQLRRWDKMPVTIRKSPK